MLGHYFFGGSSVNLKGDGAVTVKMAMVMATVIMKMAMAMAAM